MDDYKNIQKMIEDMEREIKALKCSHSIASDIRMFKSVFFSENVTDPITITYKDGENAIISDFYGNSMITIGAIHNNQQTIYSNHTSSIIPGWISFDVCSTRPILSITQ